MRLISPFLIVVLLSSLSFSQIPNAGFESWETDLDSNYNPVGWQTTNSHPLASVEPYSPGCQGSYAMKVKTVNAGFFVLPGVAILQVPISFTETPTRFSACVKSNIMPGDRAYIIVGLMSGDSVVALQDSCTFKIESTISQFTYREFPLAIQSNLVPDSLIIIVASGLGTGQVGTELIVDELAIGTGPTSVSARELLPASLSLHQNYPNPFNPTTVIRYEIPALGDQASGTSEVRLVVYDILGREVRTLLNEREEPGTHAVQFDGAGLASGVYIYRLSAGEYVESRKMVLER